MSTTELPPENGTVSELPIPESPPVHPESLLNTTEPGTDSNDPPQSQLLLDGLDPEEIPADFLLDIHDLADDYDLPLESISVGRPDE